MIKNDLADTISLNGNWDFSLGDQSAWGDIQVPGCWEAQGYSKFIEGPAHYQRKILIPDEWANQTILAEFGAVSYACEISLNGTSIGSHRGLWAPFSLDLTSDARFGEENLLELTVYKPGERYPMRSSLAGFLPDVATTFGGIWQPAQLHALRYGLDDVFIQADFDSQRFQVSCQAVWFDHPISDGSWAIEVYQGEKLVVSRQLSLAGDGKLDTYVSIPDPILWGPSHPNLYTVQVSLLEVDQEVAQTTQRVGFRRLSNDGDQLLFNGQPFMLRGILSWGWEPDMIAPVYTIEQARAEMRRVRAMGFNCIKLCLFVPNQAYFDVADEEGMLLWQEWPMWLPQVTAELRKNSPDEYSAMTRLTNQHPSVVLYSLGCELNRSVDGALLGKLNEVVRAQVSDVLVCDNSGSGESYGGLDYDFSDFVDYHPYYNIHYFEPLLDNWRRDWQVARPWIFGEFCDSDTFRDVAEIVGANDGQRPWWMTTDNPVTAWRSESRAMLEIENRLKQARPGFTSQQLVQVSYAQSMVERKYTLEALRRRSGMGGYVVTGLRDTPISTSGIWDDFYRPKWDAHEFRLVNDQAILCLDVGRRRRWHHGGDRPDRLDVHNHWAGSTANWHIILSLTGTSLVAGSQLQWTLADKHGGELAAGNSRLNQAILPGDPHEIGHITCRLPDVDRAFDLYLQVTLLAGGLKISNRWPVWVYPRPPAPPTSLGIVDPTGIIEDGDWLEAIERVSSSGEMVGYKLILSMVWDARLREYVENGGRVLLLQQGNNPLPARRCPFWRESILLFPEHTLWDFFPQRGYADMQFFGLASDVVFNSDRLAQSLPGIEAIHPIMRRLDAREFHMGEYLFESRLGKGVLLGCSLRLQGGAGAQPYGWKRNVAGSAMLAAMLDHLSNV